MNLSIEVWGLKVVFHSREGPGELSTLSDPEMHLQPYILVIQGKEGGG